MQPEDSQEKKHKAKEKSKPDPTTGTPTAKPHVCFFFLIISLQIICPKTQSKDVGNLLSCHGKVQRVAVDSDTQLGQGSLVGSQADLLRSDVGQTVLSRHPAFEVKLVDDAAVGEVGLAVADAISDISDGAVTLTWDRCPAVWSRRR